MTVNDQIRPRAIEVLSEALRADNKDVKMTHHLAEKIEHEVWSVFRNSEQAYKEKIRALHYNIKHNQALRNKIYRLLISPRQLAFIAPEDLEPAEQRESDHWHHQQDMVLEIVPDRDDIEPRPSPEDRRSEEQLY